MLKDLPLLLNPLAILTLRSIIIVMVTMTTMKMMMLVMGMTMTMMMPFQAWAGQARAKERKLIAGKTYLLLPPDLSSKRALSSFALSSDLSSTRTLSFRLEGVGVGHTA